MREVMKIIRNEERFRFLICAAELN